MTGTLPLGLTAEALTAAAAEADPDSLTAGRRMRDRFGPDLAAAALTQVALRRRAVEKFGNDADTMFFTRDGLEQASRPAVARHHAERFRAGAVSGVVDLGCGIGADARGFLAAGLTVRAVEIDARIAAVAAANLAVADPGSAMHEVLVADAETVPLDAADGRGWFADPSRRNRSGRVWQVGDFRPSWSFVRRLLDGGRVAGVKLGPALPHADILPGVEAEWLSHRGTTLEAGLWAGGTARAGARRATVVDARDPPVSLLVDGRSPDPDVGPIGRYVYEPDGAVIRAGAIGLLALELGASLIDPKIAYLSAEELVPTPFARSYEVLERLPHSERVLRQWVRANRVGTLEIKQRGIKEDPARLRRRLAPRGSAAATLLITRTPTGASVLVVRRASIE